MLRADIAVPHLPGGAARIVDSVLRAAGEFFVAFYKAYPLFDYAPVTPAIPANTVGCFKKIIDRFTNYYFHL